jgi:hypothetical protein
MSLLFPVSEKFTSNLAFISVFRKNVHRKINKFVGFIFCFLKFKAFSLRRGSVAWTTGNLVEGMSIRYFCVVL